MKQRRFALILMVLLLASPMRGDEGMWLLPLIKKLNIKDMHKIGFKLSADEIYHANRSSLKDAIIHFGGGCTGEVISPEGLVLTNHHCGYRFIQQLSSVENDYLQHGYWAMNRDEELKTDRLSVTFLESFTDVTKEIEKAEKRGKSKEEREKLVKEAEKKLIEKATKGNSFLEASVHSMYGGNSFYLVVTKTYKDIRFVGAPPSSIGKYGGDTDNWVWPRHTGDFALFRIYADKDNNPAEYSPDNIPFTPKRHLKISTAGVEQGTPAMIIGYPGRTSRFMTSAEVAYRRDVGNKIRIGAREVRQDRMMEVMLTDPAIRLEYASKHASLSNFWKKSKGMNETFARLNVEQRRAEAEQQFIEWVNRDPKRIAKYGDALDLINNSVNKNKEEMYDALLYGETLRTIELTGFANGARLIERALKVGGEEELEKAKKKYLGLIEKRMEGFYVELDRNVAKGVIKVYDEMRKREGRPAFYTTIREEFGGDIDKFVDHLYDNTIYTDIDKIKDAVENDVDKLFSDPLMDIANSLFEYTREYMAMATRAPDEDYAKGHKAYIAGQLEMRKGEALYPDANSTMRMTYGQVLDYSPRDAVHYHYVTTLDGVMEKEDADNWEFIIPEKLKELHRARDYGSYTDKDGNMPVCFISNNDITGGNSGSPVLNGKGELIGCAFDGNWEAMSGDVIFEPTYQRCINVDVRYILFLIEKYGNAKHLIDEMTIVN